MQHYVDDGLPYPLLYTSDCTDPSSICNALATNGFRNVEVVTVVLDNSNNIVPEGYTRFYIDTFPNTAEAWVSSSEGASIFFIKCLQSNLSKKEESGFTAKFLESIGAVLDLITDRVMHGRVVTVSGGHPEATLRLLLSLYRRQLPVNILGCMGASSTCEVEETHGMMFACVNGHGFNDCSPGFRTSILLSPKLLCTQCLNTEGEEYAAHVTARGDDFHTSLNFISQQRGFKVADRDHVIFPYSGICKEADFFDMSTDMSQVGNGKFLRWMEARYGVSGDVQMNEESRRALFAGLVDPASQLKINWSFEQRYFLVAKKRIEANSIMCAYGASILHPGDYIDDCQFRASSRYRNSASPFYFSCLDFRNESSFVACCGAGDRPNIVTQFVKGKYLTGEFFCCLLMKTGNSVVEADTPFAYQ